MHREELKPGQECRPQATLPTTLASLLGLIVRKVKIFLEFLDHLERRFHFINGYAGKFVFWQLLEKEPDSFSSPKIPEPMIWSVLPTFWMLSP